MANQNLIDDLRSEIERLSRELDQASSEKIQSAQYGLGLLEEKSLLQDKCDELEALYENAKHDLDITQEVYNEKLYIFLLFFLFPLVLIFGRWYDVVYNMRLVLYDIGIILY